MMELIEELKVQAEIDKLQAEAVKLEEEARHFVKLAEREGWRLFIYGIATAGGTLSAVLFAISKIMEVS